MRDLIAEYQSLTLEITRLKERIESIYSAATSAKIKNMSGMPMPSGFSGSGLEDIFIRIEKIEDRIRKKKIERDKCAAKIETKLDLAGIDPTARVVFWYREVQGKRWKEISYLTDLSVRQCQRIYQKTIYMSLLL